jgi:hypothetical protein
MPFYALRRSNWNIRRITPFLVIFLKDWRFQKWPVIRTMPHRVKTVWGAIFFFFVTMTFFVLMVNHTMTGSFALVKENKNLEVEERKPHFLFGVGLMLLIPAFAMVGWAFKLWKARKWHLSGNGVAGAFLLAYILFTTFQLTAVLYEADDYCFSGFSWVFLLINLQPMVGVAYLNGDFRIGGMSNLIHKALSDLRAADKEHKILEVDPTDGDSSTQVVNIMADIDGDGVLDAAVAPTIGPEYHLSAPPSRLARKRTTKACYILWCFGLAILAIYCWAHSALVQYNHHEDLAVLTSVSVIILDLSCLAAQAQNLPSCKSPGATSMLMGLNRVMLLGVGEDYWFVGQALAYAVGGSRWCTALAIDFVPLTTLEKATKESQLRSVANDKYLQVIMRPTIIVHDNEAHYHIVLGPLAIMH